MAQINEQFIQVKTRANFESRLSAGDIKDTSIAFIEDTSEIWAKGKYYPCPDISNLLDKVSAESTYAKLTNTVNSKALSTNPVLNGNDIKLDGFTESTEYNQDLEIETTDTVNQGLGKLQKAIKDNEEVVADTFVVFRNKIGLTENLQYIPEDASKVGNATNVKDAIDYLAGEIPTKVSDLTNDANYITSGNIPVNSVSITGSGNALVDATFTDRTLTITKGEIQSGGISEIPIASNTQLGGIKVGSGLSIEDDGTLSATGGGAADSVAWENITNKPATFTPNTHTHTASQVTGLSTVATSGSYNDLTDKPAAYTLSPATSTALGGIQIGYTENGQNYPIELDSSNKAFVTVPVNLKYEEVEGTSGELQVASMVILTQQQYDDLQTKNENTVYFIRG